MSETKKPVDPKPLDDHMSGVEEGSGTPQSGQQSEQVTTMDDHMSSPPKD